ncbi:MAG: hypothetical protein WCQ16_13200, partial [Verrucomicrobiae bacterium]
SSPRASRRNIAHSITPSVFHVEHQASQDMHIGLHKHEGKYLHTYVFTGKDGEVTDVSGYYFPRKSQVLRELDKFKKGEKK